VLFSDTSTSYWYTLSLHDALPIFCFYFYELRRKGRTDCCASTGAGARESSWGATNHYRRQAAENYPRSRRSFLCWFSTKGSARRSEEHTSELQSLAYLVCRLLLEK